MSANKLDIIDNSWLLGYYGDLTYIDFKIVREFGVVNCHVDKVELQFHEHILN